MKTFYRVSNLETQQGLWYDFEGNFTGLIHTKFNFCKNRDLPMVFDREIQGFLSATDELEDLFLWFSKEDIRELEKQGYSISKYESDVYMQYENHWIICQKSSKLIETFSVESITEKV